MNLPKTIAASGAVAGLLLATAVFAQTPPVLNVAASFPTNVNVGQQNATVATYVLSNPSSASPVSIIALPLTLSNTGLLSNCRVQNVSSAANLTTGANVLSAPGINNTLALDTPLAVMPNSGVTLVAVCDVGAGIASDTTLGVAFLPGNVFGMAAGATTTSIGLGIPAGAPFAGQFTIGGTGTPVPPGLPNTGAGGNAPVLYTLLGLAALAVVAGGVRLATARR